MRSPGNHRTRVLVLAGLLVGCLPTAKPKKGAPSDDLGTLKLPPSRPPRMALTPEEAALVYPPIDKVDRDPFLTAAEEDQYDGRPKAPVLEVAVAVARKPHVRHHMDTVIANLHQQVKGIIVGPRNTFLFDGKFYEEGDMLDSNWKVTSITERGIRLKTVDGSQSDFLPFGIDAASAFRLHPNH